MTLTPLGSAVVVAVTTLCLGGALLTASHIGEARHCHTLEAEQSPNAATYCGPQTTGSGREGESLPTSVTSAPTPASTPRVRATAASRSRQTAPVRRLGTGSLLDVTAYTHTGNRTASGSWPKVGIVASNRYPLGTKLLIEGIGIRYVEDRIGCCTDVDLFMDTEAECRLFGRQQLHVWVLS